MTYLNKLNGVTYTTLSGMIRTLRLLGYTSKRYYDEFVKDGYDGKCLRCNAETEFKKFKYDKFCSAKCCGMFNNNIGKQWGLIKSKPESNQLAYSEMLSQKAKESHSDSMWVEKRNRTIIEKYGMTHGELQSIMGKRRYANMTPAEREASNDVFITCRKKSKRFKDYILNNEIVQVQGYEPIVLDVLKKYYSEDKLSAGRNAGYFRYVSDADGKEHRYYPDIFVDKIVIEVKSSYTIGTDINLLNKLKSVYDAGYAPIILVWDLKRSEMCEKDLIETISSQALWCEGRFNDYPFIGVGYKQRVSEVLGHHNNFITGA